MPTGYLDPDSRPEVIDYVEVEVAVQVPVENRVDVPEEADQTVLVVAIAVVAAVGLAFAFVLFNVGKKKGIEEALLKNAAGGPSQDQREDP